METMTYPPGPKGHLLVGSLPEFRRRPLEFMTECVRLYGDVVYMRIVDRDVYLLNRPDLIEDVLVTNNRNFIKPQLLKDAGEVLGNGLLTSDGEFWLRQRRLAQPAFHRDRIASYATLMTGFTREMLDRWHDGETLDVHEEMMALTLNIVAQALFGADVSDKTEEVGAALEVSLQRFVDRLGFMRLFDPLPLPRNVRFREKKRVLDRIIYDIVESRRRSDEDRGDLLSMLLHAQDEDGSRMTDEQLRDEVVTLFLAGHETTAVSLVWTWHLLSDHPEVVRRLESELDEVLGDRMPTLEDIPRLPYTEMVIKESMRLYPPAWRVGREALEDCEVGGYPIPKGAQVVMSQWLMHRDGRYFDEPLRFRPERWEGDLAKRIPKFAYFPFGGGPRRCIGDSFAMMEATLLLAGIAREYRLHRVPDQTIDLWPSITLRPRHGMKMTLERRSR